MHPNGTRAVLGDSAAGGNGRAHMPSSERNFSSEGLV